MRKLLAASAAIVLASASGASAQPAFDWDRTYTGAYVGPWLEVPGLAYDSLRFGWSLGHNFQFDQFVVSAEVHAGFYNSGGWEFEIYPTVRAGFLVAPRLFLFGEAALGWDTCCGPGFMVGGGAELAVTDTISIRADTAIWKEVGDPFDYLTATVGVSWYFGD